MLRSVSPIQEGKEVMNMAQTNSKPASGKLRPGTPAPVSGIYQTPSGQQVVSTQGHPLPPGPPGTTYKPVEPAHHKG